MTQALINLSIAYLSSVKLRDDCLNTHIGREFNMLGVASQISVESYFAKSGLYQYLIIFVLDLVNFMCNQSEECILDQFAMIFYDT